jgi:hypothetical protein
MTHWTSSVDTAKFVNVGSHTRMRYGRKKKPIEYPLLMKKLFLGWEVPLVLKNTS